MSDPKPFNLGFTLQAEFQLTILQRRGLIFGASRRLATALAGIRRELQTNPREWGEATHTHRGMKCVAYVGYRDRIRVNYLVHESQLVVFVNTIEAEYGHPLHRQKE